MNQVAFISHSDCLAHESRADHPEQPARVRVIAERIALCGLLDHLDCLDAPLALESQLVAAHTPGYLNSLQTAHNQLIAAQSSGPIYLDPDTMLGPHTLAAARRAAGAAALAADLVLAGTYIRAFCNVRPPGHHAHRDRAGGFCFLNNVAIGIYAALARGVTRIALIDFDVHHGDGSEQIFANDPRVLMLSTFALDLFPHTGLTPLGSNMINVGLPPGADGTALRRVVETRWLPAIEKFRPELQIVSAGFDAHFQDGLGNMRWTDDDYAWLAGQIVAIANRHCGGRIVSILEGGYNLAALARCAELHIRGLMDMI